MFVLSLMRVRGDQTIDIKVARARRHLSEIDVK
jgi:hypothetical protein